MVLKVMHLPGITRGEQVREEDEGDSSVERWRREGRTGKRAQEGGGNEVERKPGDCCVLEGQKVF